MKMNWFAQSHMEANKANMRLKLCHFLKKCIKATPYTWSVRRVTLMGVGLDM